MEHTSTSYWKIFRLIFTTFFLFLLGDAFYRWDGFRYYATFSEFLPSVALVSILWSLTAILTATIIWILSKTVKWTGSKVGLKIEIEHSLLFTCFFLLIGVSIWVSRKYLLSLLPSSRIVLILLLITVISALFLAWLCRKRSKKWIAGVQERITPLVWLFIAWIILSLPLVAYHTLGNTERVLTDNIRHSTTNADKPNIILLTFDALTSRDMSVYGYERETTPFIDKWAEKASLFTRHEAESNITTPTTASLMTGKRVWTHRTYQLKGSKPDKIDTESLPKLLKDNGYYNIAYVVNDYASVNVLGISKSFDIAPPSIEFHVPASLFSNIDKLLYQLFGDKIKLHNWILKDDFILNLLLRKFSMDVHKTTTPPENVFNRLLWFINNNPPEPFFAWIHIMPPHDPYLPPKPYIGIYDPSLELRTYKSQTKLKNKALRYKETFGGFPPEIKPAMNTLRARYDEFIKYCDKMFENFITSLNSGNKLDDTVIILSSDHGESFEHGAIQHSGFHLYEQVTHVPLIIKRRGQTQGRVIDDLVEQIDIPATILDLANIPVPSWMEGRSLLPLMKGGTLLPRPIFSMELSTNPSRQNRISKGTFAVWEGDYKLIHYLTLDKSLLFNLRKDPAESNDLFNKEPQKGRDLLNIIQENLKRANEKILAGE